MVSRGEETMWSPRTPQSTIGLSSNCRHPYSRVLSIKQSARVGRKCVHILDVIGQRFFIQRNALTATSIIFLDLNAIRRSFQAQQSTRSPISHQSIQTLSGSRVCSPPPQHPAPWQNRPPLASPGKKPRRARDKPCRSSHRCP